MKKTNILIAVFMVLAAAATAKATEVTVDFDGSMSGNQASDRSSKGSLLDLIAAAASSAENCGGLMACGTGLPPGMQTWHELPNDALPQVPAPSFQGENPFPSYVPGSCALYCQYGYNYESATGGCSCKPDPWNTIWELDGGMSGFTCNETDPNSWVGMAMCHPGTNAIAMGAAEQVKSKKATRETRPALQKHLLDILLEYCDTYPEFAAAVLPMLKDGKAKIGVYDGFVHIVNGKRIIRFAGKAAVDAEQKTSPQRSGAGFRSTAALAADAVISAINAGN